MSQDDFFNQARRGEDHPGFNFENVGDTIRGKIVAPPKTVDTKWGQRLLVSLQTDSGDTFNVWIKPNQMGAAVVDAVLEAGEKRMEEGGTLALKHHATKPTDKGQPMKLFQAKYQAPVAGVAADDLF